MKILILCLNSFVTLYASEAPFNIYDGSGNSINDLNTGALVMAATIPAPKNPVDWGTVTFKLAPSTAWGAYRFNDNDNWTLLNLAKFSKKIGTDMLQGYSIKSLIQTQIKDEPTVTLSTNVLTLTSTLAKQTISVSEANTFSFSPLTLLDKTSITLQDILSHYTGPYPKDIAFSTILNSGTISPSGNLACDVQYVLAKAFPITYVSPGTTQALTLYFNKNKKQSGILTLTQS